MLTEARIPSAPTPGRLLLRRLPVSRFRLKVAVFMLPLLLPVGQNLSRQPAEADGGVRPHPAPDPGPGSAGAPPWGADDAGANPPPDAAVPPA